jgi:F0F1-type ATP synthase membrane subunit b/b'
MVLAATVALGCDKAVDDQENAGTSQNAANEEIAALGRKADHQIQKAQAEADEKIAAANADFMRLREQYIHKTADNLREIDRKVEHLEAELQGATRTSKVDLESNLSQISALRRAFAADYAVIESASARTWEDRKARLDKEMTSLKALVEAT